MIKKYGKYFSESKFKEKLLRLMRKAGSKLLYPAVLLYTIYKSRDVKTKDKAIILGALGYFILPHDLIADIIPMLGFTDDLAVLSIVIKSLSDSITPQIKESAKEKLYKMIV